MTMNKKTFNPNEWLDEEPKQNVQTTQNTSTSSDEESRIEELVNRVENASIDLTASYSDWRDLGFALADALGENGRGYYQRLSRFYSGYSEQETDRQYDKCLAAKGSGITIKTLFGLAKNAGISISMPKNVVVDEDSEVANDDNNEEVVLPCFPDSVYDNLPDLLSNIVSNANSPQDADVLLLGSIVVFSSVLPRIHGIYAGRQVFPNLFLFVSAQASGGKGRLSLCRHLVEPIHNMMLDQGKAEFEQYQMMLAQYVIDKKGKNPAEKPVAPPMRLLIIPANNSATGMFQLLNDNNQRGLIFETEGDTLAQTFKSDYGDYSDGFRKAFHHETISYNRRTDHEYVEMNRPQLSALLSGTPKQINALIPNAENGLFSRFIFYSLTMKNEWMDVFADSGGQTLDERFLIYGRRFFELYRMLSTMTGSCRIVLSENQKSQFNEHFKKTQERYLELCGNDYVGTVRRLGLITFRIAMILTAIRIMDDGVISEERHCTDADFNTALEMSNVLVEHACYTFSKLPGTETVKAQNNPKLALFNALPNEFDRPTYLAAAKRLGIIDRTADKQILRFTKAGLLNRLSQGNYEKVNR